MRATVDIPDALYRRVTARAVLDGRTVADVTIELYEKWLAAGRAQPGRTASAMDGWLERWRAFGDAVERSSVNKRPVSEIIDGERERQEIGDDADSTVRHVRPVERE